MTIRLIGATTVVAFVAAAVATSASPSTTASKSCGTVKGGGATWSVVAVGGVSCSAAKPLVKKLAAKPHAGPATRLGTYIGLKCIEFAGQGKREIACVSKNGGRSVFGVSPPGKK